MTSMQEDAHGNGGPPSGGNIARHRPVRYEHIGGTERASKPATEETPTDYSDPSHWFRIPDIVKDVDTIYFYPTLYDGNKTGDGSHAAIDDEGMLSAVGPVYLAQGSVFEESTNVFVPYYRQASMKHEMDMYLETGSADAALDGKPLADAWAALDCYFENHNGGRPFILAGHSQGSILAKLVLKTYFKDRPELYERMVAAYLLGYSVTRQDLDEHPHLRFASGEADTGVIVSWNREGPANIEAHAVNMVVLDGSIAINPLNWRRDDAYAPASKNLGSLVMDMDAGVPEFSDIGADAQVNVERGVVVTNADAEEVEELLILFGPQSFHTGDYAFYYMNIRDNVAKRIAAYLGAR